MANNNSNLIEKLLGGSGLNQVWVKVFSLVKILTGDVDVKNKGNLQKQIDDVRSDVEGIMDGTGDTGLVFADDTESEYDTAIGQVVSGKPLSVLFQYLKAALKSAYTLAQKAYNVAAGKNQARVFATVDALDEWLGDPDNLAQLHVGDNFYIVALDVPDYWWDGEQKQPLETQKVDMTTYDQAIAALQSADTKLNEDITDHKSSADHDSRYYTKAQNKLIKCKDVQIKATQDRSATLKIDTYGGFAIPILADPGSRAWEIYVGLQYATDTLVLSGEGIAAGYTYTVRIFYFQ